MNQRNRNFITKIIFSLLILVGTNPRIFSNPRILIGSPIKEKPQILKEFLESLNELDKENLEVDYCFIDDNIDIESQNLITKFTEKNETNCTVFTPEDKPINYKCNDDMQYYSEELIWRNSGFKNFLLNKVLEEGYDYLLLIDSNIIFNPKILKQLINDQKDIVSCLVWQKAESDKSLPQVWLYDTYIKYEPENKNNLNQEEINLKQNKFLDKLNQPGIYKIGGVGACTLISKEAINSGVNFDKIKNISTIGEDKHFSIRTAALGLELFVDTYYPAYSINEEKDLAKIQEYKNNFKKNKNKIGKKLTLSMIIENDANRYLIEALEEIKEYIDEAVIIDNSSTDNSVEICKNILKNIPLKIIKNDKSKISNELDLRKLQWEETIKTNPDWILNLDSDQVFEKSFRHEIKNIINQDQIDLIYFRAYDFWDKEHYREDENWLTHKNWHPFLCRYKKNYDYIWSNSEPCCRFPENVMLLPCAYSKSRVKNYSWIDQQDKYKNYKKYLKLDKEAQYWIKRKHETIFDPNPKLTKWVE